MVDSFQKEIPKARVNITLDVETGGSVKKKELPLKLLVAGDFSNGKTKGPIAERERININKNNFNKIIAELAPELNFTVANRIKNDGTEMRVGLKIDSLKKLHPEAIVEQIPELQNLLAMRNLLKDLKANLLDNGAFRRRLEQIVKNKSQLKMLQDELHKQAPLESEILINAE
ncbi:MAG: type VI secretion protein [Coxiella sp. DG_40]|nr:MAG: type VI secretion protein [Coxiella sp. DG_40]